MLVAAGALTGLTQPPTDLWPLMFLCVPVLILTLDSADRQRRMAQFCPGFLFGLGYFSVVLHWIGFAFLVDAETYLWMMPFMVGALAGGMSVYWGLATLVAGRMWCGGICRNPRAACSPTRSPPVPCWRTRCACACTAKSGCAAGIRFAPNR